MLTETADGAYFNLMQTYTERLARRIRVRLVQNRQQAAKNPKTPENLIGTKAIEQIVDEEERIFDSAVSFQPGIKGALRRGDSGCF